MPLVTTEQQVFQNWKKRRARNKLFFHALGLYVMATTAAILGGSAFYVVFDFFGTVFAYIASGISGLFFAAFVLFIDMDNKSKS